ncbi:hypothetical protein Q4567_06310 [Aliiglaciecola sp. 2_MG-2023]|uniref:hypothetical protein n=1 Tax=unclassified Aliiglaciecola TaxID=2593648 RepID=UPI0026E3AE6B|nr:MULTISPECIES: hypothetical protein [unclassified Aliiglaciecola]MDO6710327.1 hypothetical protein [Aliiglaciecola sp. 2_MG-2023]MDO6751474.1 hypothetical protein [Aliiglaciecola sp. 1_MG-2023]
MKEITTSESTKITFTEAGLSKITNAVNLLLAKWEVSEEQKSMLIGDITSSERQLRLSLLLNIHEELRSLFSNSANYYGFMNMLNHNEPFNGSRPIDLACKNLEGLKHTYAALSNIGGL